jgi:tetratricopeptide (TPR) repeat protein
MASVPELFQSTKRPVSISQGEFKAEQSMPKLCSLVMAVWMSGLAATAQGLEPVPGEDIAAPWREKLQEASRLRASGALDASLKGLEAALEMARRLGEDSSYVGVTLSRIGSVYLDLGKEQQAKAALSRALQNLEKNFGPEHGEVLGCLTDLGVCHRKMGLYVEAERDTGRVLAIVQKSGRSQDLAAALFAMGLLYSETGRHAQAIDAFRPALQLVEKSQDSSPTGALATVLLYMGNAYVQQGRFREGDPILRRALRSAILAYGPDAPQVAYVQCALAVLESGRGQSRAAEARLRRALPAFEAAWGPVHPSVGSVLVSLAETVRLQGRHAEAQALAERGVKIMEGPLGEGPLVIGEGLAVLANAILGQHDYARAESLYRRALGIFSRIGGENDMRTAAVLTSLAIARAHQGDAAEAALLHQRALRIEESVAGSDSSQRAITLTEYAKVLRQDGQKRRAADMEREARTMYGRLRNANTRITVDVSELK